MSIVPTRDMLDQYARRCEITASLCGIIENNAASNTIPQIHALSMIAVEIANILEPGTHGRHNWESIVDYATLCVAELSPPHPDSIAPDCEGYDANRAQAAGGEPININVRAVSDSEIAKAVRAFARDYDYPQSVVDDVANLRKLLSDTKLQLEQSLCVQDALAAENQALKQANWRLAGMPTKSPRN